MLGVDPSKADDDFKIMRFWMESGKPMFELSHSTDGAGNSFTPRMKVKGKAELSARASFQSAIVGVRHVVDESITLLLYYCHFIQIVWQK